jgi:general secretion pathway protein K
MTTREPHPRPSSDGFIVVAVLWIIGALATLVAIYAIYVAGVASNISVSDDRLQSEALMTAALELAAIELTPTQGDKGLTHGQFTFRAGHANVVAQFKSESARIDLNQAPKELIAGLFEVLGAAPEQAKNYADNVIAWRTPSRPRSGDNEGSRYLAAGLGYTPRGGPFAHPDELWLVHDLPSDLVERAMPYVTVYSGVADVDALEAAPEVIAAQPGMTSDKLNALLQRRGMADAPSSPARSFDPTGTSTETSKATRVSVDIYFENGRKVRSEAVISVSDSDDTPYRVLSWHDGFDDPMPEQSAGPQQWR